MCHTCEACRKLKGQHSWITTGQKLQTGLLVIWQLELMTHPSHKWLASAPYFAEKWLFIFLLIPYYKYPYTYKMYRDFREKFERETLENNKIDSSTILYIWFSEFLYCHCLHCHTHERILSQILTSLNFDQWEGSWCLGSNSRENQFILVDAMG